MPPELRAAFGGALSRTDITLMKEGFFSSNNFDQREMRENFNPKNLTIIREDISGDEASV